MIAGGELGAFVRDVAEAKEDRELWELYLAKVDGKSFYDFKDSMHARPQATACSMTEGEILAQTLDIVNMAMDADEGAAL